MDRITKERRNGQRDRGNEKWAERQRKNRKWTEGQTKGETDRVTEERKVRKRDR